MREQEVIPGVQCGIGLRPALLSFFHLVDIMVIMVIVGPGLNLHKRVPHDNYVLR